MFSTPNHQGGVSPNQNPNQFAAMQEQVSPLHRAVNFADEYDGDEEGDSEGGRGHQGYRNQNPPTPLGYGNESVGGNGFYDDRDDRYESDNAQRGQANEYQGNPNHNQQNRNNHGQNHNRNEQQFKNRPPNQLCKRFGFRDDCSFDTFEFDFQLACEMHQIPAREKVNWLLMHLEGPIKEHACS
ncbi:MAG: hypothetical protein GY820_24490, partial [Gammaproteobacteria bacterium]|nr:hypothetical protein [Gammaproteobacteria bacterium]